MDLKKELIDAVIARRKELGVSKMEMSKKTGMSYYNYRRFEMGENISLNGFLSIVDVLGLKIKF